MIHEEKQGKANSEFWWAERTKKLLEDQKISWEKLNENYNNLGGVLTRSFEFDGFHVDTQYNPARIISSSAEVDENTIKERKCFLCLQNLPSEQNGLKYDKNFIILCNPFPIFNEHFTITNKKHMGQTIIGHYDDLLNISRDLGKYYDIFYNGPKCGASAPDHMHFQAGSKNFLPAYVEYDLLKERNNTNVLKSSKIEIRFIENALRNFIVFESNSKGELLYAFKIFVKANRNINKINEEPMMNIVSSYIEDKWRIIIFPRSKHRPTHFYKNGDEKILISPAAVDMTGLLIFPRLEDFKKINKEVVVEIYKQVSITKEYFEYIKKKLSEIF
jgi:ATP adenylyltransferase/5',5'''-P-1,P-4-tetraphosphate phosphorylase II